MALSTRIDARIVEMEQERTAIERRRGEELAAVDRKIALLRTAQAQITKTLDSTYDALLREGLIKEI